ncbi:MAG: hypothetical protein L3J49_14430, partial [Desulfobulbaceae bacterium]|nr:hypothetical protein [Desulfobulbaceae bacterium]
DSKHSHSFRFGLMRNPDTGGGKLLTTFYSIFFFQFSHIFDFGVLRFEFRVLFQVVKFCT